MKKIIKNLFKTILVLIILFAMFLVGVVAYVAESPQEFFSMRRDNIIEYFLNKEDGLSHIDMAKCVYCAYVTTIEASTTYPDNKMLEDAYKHYTWNFESTRLIGEEKTKLITDNHEVALTVRPKFDEVYYSLCTQYGRKRGLLYYPVSVKALIGAASKLPEIRKTVVDESRNVSSSEIRTYYSSATIMDFYNNELGRCDSLNHPNVNRRESFNTMISNGQIIETYDNLDDAYNDYTVDYVKNKIRYWVSWLEKGRESVLFHFKKTKSEFQ